MHAEQEFELFEVQVEQPVKQAKIKQVNYTCANIT